MKLNIVGEILEITPRTDQQGNLRCDVLLALPTFGNQAPVQLMVGTSKNSAEQAKRMAPGARVYIDARLSSDPPKGERKFWSTSVYAFSIEPIGTANAYTAARRGDGYGNDPF